MEIGMNFETNFALLSSLFLELPPSNRTTYLSAKGEGEGDSRSNLG
jgi:hypothetical protein